MEFEDQQFRPRYAQELPGQSGMTGWLIKKGIVKDASFANYILLGLVALFIIATISVYFIFIKQPAAPEIDQDLIANPEFDPALNPDFEI